MYCSPISFTIHSLMVRFFFTTESLHTSLFYLILWKMYCIVRVSSITRIFFQLQTISKKKHLQCCHHEREILVKKKSLFLPKANLQLISALIDSHALCQWKHVHEHQVMWTHAWTDTRDFLTNTTNKQWHLYWNETHSQTVYSYVRIRWNGPMFGFYATYAICTQIITLKITFRTISALEWLIQWAND